YDVGERRLGLGQRGGDGLERLLGLSRRIVGDRAALEVVAGGPGDEDPVAVDDGAAIAGELLEFRSGRDAASRHAGSLRVGAHLRGSRIVCRCIYTVKPQGSGIMNVTTRHDCEGLDAADPLREMRARFAPGVPGTLYFDANSVGAMPLAAP